MTRLAYFITSHGFGHATRASAVMSALHEADASLSFDVFTEVPRWVFEDSLPFPIGYRSCRNDVGVIQATPLAEDLGATASALAQFLPFDRALIESLAAEISANEYALVLADIAPLGLVVAREARVPSVLVENFTWDWVYRDYGRDHPAFEPFADYLRNAFDAATWRIQTHPACNLQPAAAATGPVSRRPRNRRAEVRTRLGVPDEAALVLVTMGGTPHRLQVPPQVRASRDVRFVLPGGNGSMAVRDNVIVLPHRSEFYHPDLVHAADAVIGKVGYSTLAEVFSAGVPYGYVPRPRFPESSVLVSYIEQHLEGVPITAADFTDGTWVSRIPELLARPRLSREGPGGADQAARHILRLLD